MVTVLSPPLLTKPRPSFGRKGDAVNAGEIRNIASHFQGFGVDNHDVASARNEEPLAVFVVIEVVPASLATEFDGIDYLVLFLCEGWHGGQQGGRENSARIRFIGFPLSVRFCKAGFVTQIKMDSGSDDQREHHRNRDASDYRDGERLQHL